MRVLALRASLPRLTSLLPLLLHLRLHPFLCLPFELLCALVSNGESLAQWQWNSPTNCGTVIPAFSASIAS